MSKSKTVKSAPIAQKGAMSANDISPETAMLHVIATNLMTIAFADVPDVKARIAHARHRIISEQPSVTLSMRRLLERSESYVLSAMQQIRNENKQVH